MMTPGGSESELRSCHPRLRRDLRTALMAAGGRTHCQLEDPLTAKYYRLGSREWQCVEAWDGTKSLADQLAHAPPHSDAERLGRADLLALHRWLQQAGLLESDANSAPRPAASRTVQQEEAFWSNPVFLRVPLWNPDRALERCLPWCSWTLAAPALVVWCVTVVASLSLVLVHWDQFRQPWATMLAADRWLQLLLVWFALKVVHEFYHGLACKRWGGRVTTCGLMFVFFSPVAYVDVTSSWQFRSRWQRIMTAAAGMYAELFVASVATWVWYFSDDPSTRQFCHEVMGMAGVSTLVFNANFLMKYDGYFILSDLLDIQNLYGLGQLHVRDWMRHHLLGLPSSTPLSGTRSAAWVRVYGWASFAWRLVFYAGVLFTASAMFHGAGVVLAVLIGISWFLRPAYAFARTVVRGRQGECPSRLRLAMIVGAVLLLGVGIGRLPWPGGVRAFGVVDYDPPCVVRAGCPGLVRTLHVHSGQWVRQGDLLVTLENDQVVQDLTDARVAVEQSLVRERMAASSHDAAQQQVERKRRESFEKQCLELRHRVEQLSVVAPAEGRVVAADLETLLGQYLALGAPLLELGDERCKGVQVEVSQDDAERFARHLGCEASIRVRGRATPVHGARLARLHPQGSRALTAPALAASQGGPLAVVPVAEGTPGNVELLEPHFQAFLELPADAAASLHAGQLAQVHLHAPGRSVARHLWQQGERWIRGHLEATAENGSQAAPLDSPRAADRRR